MSEENFGPRGRAAIEAAKNAYQKMLNKFEQGVHATVHIDDIPKWLELRKKLSDMGLSMNYNGKRRECGMSLILDISLAVINEIEPVADAYNYSTKEYLEQQFKPFLAKIKEEYLKQSLLKIHKESHDEIHGVVIKNVNDKLQKEIKNINVIENQP